jgi:hypothetical protein
MDGTNMHTQATQIYLAIKGIKQPYLFDIQLTQL